MRKISAVVRLDFYTIKPYNKSLLLLFAMAIMMTMVFQSTATLCFYLMMCLMMVMMYPFSIGETNKLDILYATLSLRRGNIVVGRYAFALCMEIMAVLLALILSWGFSFFTPMEFSITEILLSLCIASFLFTIIVSFQYPIYFKLGYNKAKFIAYAPLLIVSLSVALLPNLLRNLGVEIDFDDIVATAHPFLLYGLPVLTGHLLFALSCGLSRRLYEKRDI